MERLILPIIMIIICTIALIAMVYFMKRGENKSKKTTTNPAEKTAQEFVNVADIRDTYLYTLDGYIISYIKVPPISIDLMSENEKKALERTLTAELSSEDEAFKLIAISRAIDITPLIDEYMELLSESSDPIQKEILRDEIREITALSTSGDVIERQFYYVLWQR